MSSELFFIKTLLPNVTKTMCPEMGAIFKTLPGTLELYF